jgi:signal transduction histidine kinase
MALNSMLLRIEVDRQQLKKTVNSLEEANKELIQTQNEMVVAEKLAAVGRLSAGLAHEIGNPLGIIQGYVELLQQADVSAKDRHQFAQRALDELERINRLIRQLLDFARATPKPFENFSLNQLLIELREMFVAQYSDSKIKLFIEVGNDCNLEGDRDGIKQVLLNCLLNAADSIDSCERDIARSITITVSSQMNTDNEVLVLIRIEDSGHGISADQQDFLFEPFYSTKASGKGTGLGLFVSHSIIENHNGRMWIEGKERNGAAVTIEVPQKQLHEV